MEIGSCDMNKCFKSFLVYPLRYILFTDILRNLKENIPPVRITVKNCLVESVQVDILASTNKIISLPKGIPCVCYGSS